MRQRGRSSSAWLCRGGYRPAPEVVEAPRPPTFADAALAYLKAGGEAKFLGKIIEATGDHALRDKPLSSIDQIAIDNAARGVYPLAPATTLNRKRDFLRTMTPALLTDGLRIEGGI
ncbi:hypothetical protein IVB55_01955 [Bradyrhizobium sp. CW4]|uniref:hypothetical protein n=1 Tax=Bradyrhizobium sp. CW4 TaxID=2782687 RepID=UPI001FF7CC34|nr:hypothetical protein [Bradyrhizobium sp. CW4]MCK1411866.1 hypothetical protein [Bradyrhizobium sp. CW4]